MYTEKRDREREREGVNLFNNNKCAVNMHTVNGRIIKIPLNSFHLKEKFRADVLLWKKGVQKTQAKRK